MLLAQHDTRPDSLVYSAQIDTFRGLFPFRANNFGVMCSERRNDCVVLSCFIGYRSRVFPTEKLYIHNNRTRGGLPKTVNLRGGTHECHHILKPVLMPGDLRHQSTREACESQMTLFHALY